MRTPAAARARILAAALALTLSSHVAASAQQPGRSLVAVFAHDDDEVMAAPILARYAREGAQVYVILATDGAQGGMHTTIPRGPELARVRAEEARCATDALGIHPPILLGFPDAKLGDYASDPTALYRLTERVQAELQRLRPDAIITFGPEGAVGHPDHRLVGDVVTQLVRAGAPGTTERLFYVTLPAEAMRAMNPQRGAPPTMVPLAKYLSVRVPFAAADLQATRREMLCHRTQLGEDVVARIFPLMAQSLNGAITLAPAFSTAAGTDVFR